MCLGVPAKIIEKLTNHVALADVQGNQVKISIAMVPAVEVGQHVLIHAGFAIEIIDEDEALQTMELLEELNQFREMP